MSYRHYLIGKKVLKIRYWLACLVGKNHIDWLKKHDVFDSIGDKCFYQPMQLPNEPKLIRLHNNVKIATNVTFFTHDVINAVIADIDNIPYQTHAGCIEIFDNVFIGGGATVVGSIRIGPDAIVAAGSVVTKDVPKGAIVGGNPARVIGSFYDMKKKRYLEDGNLSCFDPEEPKRRNALCDSFSKKETI